MAKASSRAPAVISGWCYAVFLQGPPLRMLSVTRDMAVVLVAGPDHAVLDTTTVEIDTKYMKVVFVDNIVL